MLIPLIWWTIFGIYAISMLIRDILLDLNQSKTDNLAAYVGMLLICMFLLNIGYSSYNSVKKSTEIGRRNASTLLHVTYEVNALNFIESL